LHYLKKPILKQSATAVIFKFYSLSVHMIIHFVAVINTNLIES